jgi:protein-S-isoprenylcysteine O-methyltransferase Ste14
MGPIVRIDTNSVLLRNKTPFDPAKTTLKIVHQGPNRLSRNPMYLALLLLMAGTGVFTGSIWMCLAGCVWPSRYF